ncbi:MAG: M1 family peptidase, partial [Chloroflexota bacterium]
MRRYLVLFLVMWIGGGVGAQGGPQPGKAGAGDNYYPGLGNGGYDVAHYTLDLTVDVASNTLLAVAEIDLTPEIDLSSFNLDL